MEKFCLYAMTLKINCPWQPAAGNKPLLERLMCEYLDTTICENILIDLKWISKYYIEANQVIVWGIFKFWIKM